MTVWHYMSSPGVAWCRADYPDMAKTVDRTKVTCLTCSAAPGLRTADATRVQPDPNLTEDGLHTCPGGAAENLNAFWDTCAACMARYRRVRMTPELRRNDAPMSEIQEARNEASVVRRAYLHEKGRAEKAISYLRQNGSEWCSRKADRLEAEAYREPSCLRRPEAPSDGTFGFAVTFEDRENAAGLLERVTFYCKGLVVPDRNRFLAEASWMFGAVRSRRERGQAVDWEARARAAETALADIGKEAGYRLSKGNPRKFAREFLSNASVPNSSAETIGATEAEAVAVRGGKTDVEGRVCADARSLDPLDDLQDHAAARVTPNACKTPCGSYTQQQLDCTLPDGHEGPHLVRTPEWSDRFQPVPSTPTPSVPLDGPGSHRADLAALRAEQAENDQLRAQLAAYDAMHIDNGPTPSSRATPGWPTVLGDALARAEKKHPSGTDGLRSLTEEVGEVANAMRRETVERVRAELIDVAVVAVRFWNELGSQEPEDRFRIPAVRLFNRGTTPKGGDPR